ncbi:MAG: SPFH domain-containing protein [Bacillales bacterium]
MFFFRNQFANVVEWEEFRDDMIFYKWSNREIKKGSRLIIRPGQDAIFLYNGKIEGIFTEEGDYDIESEIIPFLSTLKGFKFGFNSGLRAEVLFVNTRDFVVKWGTRNAINIPAPGLPGGLPIRANGTVHFKVNDYVALIDNVAGVRDRYLVEDVRIRIMAVLDQLLMKWIPKAGKNLFNLQANAFEIAKGIREDLDMEVLNLGLTITGFNIMSFNYPKEIQDMITKNASHSMIGDLGRYQQVSLTDALASGKLAGAGTAADMAGMMMGMNLAEKMMKKMKETDTEKTEPETKKEDAMQGGAGKRPNFCPNCGTKVSGGNFCSNCGYKLV